MKKFMLGALVGLLVGLTFKVQIEMITATEEKESKYE